MAPVDVPTLASPPVRLASEMTPAPSSVTPATIWIEPRQPRVRRRGPRDDAVHPRRGGPDGGAGGGDHDPVARPQADGARAATRIAAVAARDRQVATMVRRPSAGAPGCSARRVPRRARRSRTARRRCRRRGSATRSRPGPRSVRHPSDRPSRRPRRRPAGRSCAARGRTVARATIASNRPTPDPDRASGASPNPRRRDSGTSPMVPLDVVSVLSNA